MNSPVKLPPLPPIPWAVLGGIANDCVSAEAIHEYATAYAAQAVRPYVTALETHRLGRIHQPWGRQC